MDRKFSTENVNNMGNKWQILRFCQHIMHIMCKEVRICDFSK